jgi:hypothetical protein
MSEWQNGLWESGKKVDRPPTVLSSDKAIEETACRSFDSVQESLPIHRRSQIVAISEAQGPPLWSR